MSRFRLPPLFPATPDLASSEYGIRASLRARSGPPRRFLSWLLSFTLSVLALPAAAAPADRTEQLQARIDAIAAKTLASGTPGLHISVAGPEGLRLSRAYGMADLEHRVPVTDRTVFAIASLTKQFTAASVLLMVEDGRLSLDDKLSRFVPELPQASRVTIRQLLLQTSGLPDYAEDPAGQHAKSVARTLDEMLAWIARLQPAFLFEPGTSWSYSNSNYQLLGLVVARVSGKPLATVFQERLFARAGLTHTAFDDPAEIVPDRARGYRKSRSAPGGFVNAAWLSPTIPGPAGGLRSTPADLLAWTAALHSGRILKAESLKLMTAPGLLSDGRTTKSGMPAPMQKGWNSAYGMGLLIGSPSGRQRIWHAGDMDGFSSWLAFYPEFNVTILILHNSDSAERFEQEIEEAVLATAR